MKPTIIEVLWSITRVMEVSLESSFQPLVQLYIVFPQIVEKFQVGENEEPDTVNKVVQMLTTIVQKCEGKYQMDQTMSIMTSILGMGFFPVKGPFTNYVYKRRGVGGKNNRLFVNFFTIENVNGGD